MTTPRAAIGCLLLVLASCDRGSSEPRTSTPGTIWAPGEWTIKEVWVLDSNVPDPPGFQPGDAVRFEMDRIVSERRGSATLLLTRGAIEDRLGVPLDEYTNEGGSSWVQLTMAVDRLAEPEGFRLDYRLQVQVGDWGMPPGAIEEWQIDWSDGTALAWRAYCQLGSVAR